MQNSDHQDVRVLIVCKTEKQADQIEASFEQDSAFIRVRVYTATSVNDSRDLARKYGISLAIFPENIESRDFVATAQELKSAQPTISLIPLIGIPSIAQLRESKKIGNIVDYGRLDQSEDIDS